MEIFAAGCGLSAGFLGRRQPFNAVPAAGDMFLVKSFPGIGPFFRTVIRRFQCFSDFLGSPGILPGFLFPKEMPDLEKLRSGIKIRKDTRSRRKICIDERSVC
ncbi:MAG: hypothetical protein C6P37_06710 [Caldibacillus debilis]|uniref:Uncharacterized protein n=1 Tax=Caldibacillus debilis TaxID=301148 RepID=A0A3E0K5C1_9BACI|nr:MAG: hypothetical protein C6P37_06710 [Caldibacillus debilis]